MPTYIQIAVNVPSIMGVFDYHLPPEIASRVSVGCLVVVPFGKQTVQGVVVGFVAVPSVPETKAVIDVLDPQSVLTAAQLEFAKKLANDTLNPLAAIIDMMLPAGLSKQADVLYTLTETKNPNTGGGEIQKRLVELLITRGPLRGRQIERHFGKVDWRRTAQVLLRQRFISSQSVLPPPTVRIKFVRTAQLAITPEEAEAVLSTAKLGNTEAVRTRRRKALEFLLREPDIIRVTWIYAESGCNIADLEFLHEQGWIILLETEIFRDPLQNIKIEDLKKYKDWATLTDDQQKVWNEIERAFKEQSSGKTPAPFLLHGVTGSGKTEIYLRATAEALRHGKQAIILVPEIALTPQIVRRFLGRFPGQVGLVHSKLSDGERYDTWRRTRAGALKVIIGARSALFAPLPNVGLIIADECHDNSFYQSEPPFYHAIHAALQYAQISGAVCLLGSATPPVALRYQASGSALHLLELPERLTPLTNGGVSVSTELPPVHIVDMREELKAGNRGIFSRALMEALAGTLERNEQAILFLNRRGMATYVFCRECGYVVKCPRCDTPLTLHVESLNSNTLTCHHCGYSRQTPKTCPECRGVQIRAYGLGSEKVEAEVKALLPEAQVLRWDWETTREKDAHEMILSHFVNHRADVLVGTQMLAKGLDLPLVTLVGIVLADVGLNMPDPFAGERVFQVLTQVAGRAGRSMRGGQVVLQTFEPDNEIIKTAARHDYRTFYSREIAGRRQLGYPPFARLARLEFRHVDPAEAEKVSIAMGDRLKSMIDADKRIETDLIGPVPCAFAKLNGQYRWQVILRGPEPVSLLRGLRLQDGWRVEIDPVSLL